MGLAATQVRLLQLTARQHRIEYQAQKIQAQKLQLANESDAAYMKYMNALDAKKIQYKRVESDGSIFYEDAKFSNMFQYVEGSGIQAQYALEILNDPDESNIGKYYVSNNVHTAYVQAMSETGDEAQLNKFISSFGDSEEEKSYYTNLFNLLKTGKGTVPISEKQDTNMWLTNMLANGYLLIHKWNVDEGEDGKGAWMDSSVSTDMLLIEVEDEKELKKAEATYEAETKRINRKDAQYDTILAQTDVERNAIKTERDTLKTVKTDNINMTFKLFS